MSYSPQHSGDVRNGKPLADIEQHFDLIFSMNGDMPHVPITTLAGIASLTDRKCAPVSS